jgi:hypothetical protein
MRRLLARLYPAQDKIAMFIMACLSAYSSAVAYTGLIQEKR